MARINDQEGSTFDAPLDMVWRYLQNPEAHGGAHKGTRNRGMKPINETSFVVSWEQDIDGTWVKFANRITVFPPLGMVAEALEGPLTGTKMFTVYTPHGAKTEISVYADAQSPAGPAHQIEPVLRRAWETAFNEDSAGIREFTAKSK
jgi:hypothetical protein